ncbi:flagellar basal body rod C-terminal domain-containing protein [Sphingosinicella sp. BN140058]|uniref:FlgK family flagellar hook-associated protein n=1 Tax=Sphingosinicella sp. BN140058 TaxID=1892855 RepID=UPI001011305A|nr:flagellar basal body rod C-terminal domain-containing protein [Sphingosinicella sp. BN140058]QAY77289.1 flagellar biosynthesis protein FlgK [Sphingosinicella sp. BN140058]
MSLNEILGSAISGLNASQSGLRSVSNNIANVGTAGYARERVGLTTAVTNGRVNGVIVGEPERVADRFLELSVYKRSGDMGQSEVTASYMDRLQAFLGEPGSESGLPARLDAISASAVRLTSGQAANQNVAAFVGDVEDAITSIRRLDGDVSSLRTDVESEVGYTVERTNGLLSRVYELNNEVARLQGLGKSPAGAIDQRVAALEELSTLVKVSVRDQPDGRVILETPQGATLLDRRLRQLDYSSAGTGVAQPVYPSIGIRFAESNGTLGAATGDKIDSAAIGGKLGGLIDLRDRALPQFADKLGQLFGGLAQTLNAAANAGTAVPPPARLDGRPTGVVGTDRLGFTGAATFAVTKSNGDLVAKTTIDFSGMATVDDAVAAINAGLGGAGTATFADGKLVIAASASGNGVALAQDEANPSSRAGVGFSQYFGLNDLIRSKDSPLVPSGFVGTDPHGFAPGQTTDIVLRDASGRSLTKFTLSPAGTTFNDLVGQLNASPLADYGDFALDSKGRIQFQPDAAVSGASLTIVSDSTDRLGTGQSFSALSALTGASMGLGTGQVRPDIGMNAALMPLARLQTNVAVGERALGQSDLRGGTGFVEELAKLVDFGSGGVATLERFSGLLLGGAGTEAAQATEAFEDASARRDDAVNRRDGFSGVSIDEELAQMVVLQNSYSAAARVISTATEMYDTLINMVR